MPSAVARTTLRPALDDKAPGAVVVLDRRRRRYVIVKKGLTALIGVGSDPGYLVLCDRRVQRGGLGNPNWSGECSKSAPLSPPSLEATERTSSAHRRVGRRYSQYLHGGKSRLYTGCSKNVALS